MNGSVVWNLVEVENYFEEYRFGYQIEGSDFRHEWFKLGLDPSSMRESKLAIKYPSPTQLPPRSAPSSEKLTTDYLTALHQHAEYTLEQTFTRGVLKSTPREYIITVPAVWSDMAKDLTRSCAAEAGMGSRNSLHIISEPEAAAMYALSAMNCGLEVGDTFVVCDAGGGTVDLISYTVSSKDPVLQLNEAAPGTGDLCGSTFLNRIFSEYLNNKFKGDYEWESDSDILATAMEHFETQTKSSFHGDQGDYIPVHGLKPRPGIIKGRLMVSKSDLRDIFKPVVSQIITLVRKQINETQRKVKLILLVGGLGSSPYLRNRLREEFGKDIVKMAMNRQLNHLTGGYSVPCMKWFLKKVARHLYHGRLTNDVMELGQVKADLRGIPKASLEKRLGEDDRWYYNVDFEIEMTCYAAKTKYTPVYKGKRYEPATMEYV
ncbi:MAG: hypothetical protein Q9187_004122 [Circinaria calcarea]